MKKVLSTLLAALLLVTAMAAMPVSAAETVRYEETFNYSANDADFAETFLEQEQWMLESTSNSHGGYPGKMPEVKGDKLILSKGDSVMFDWTQVSGIGSFDSAKTYTFSFDFNVTSDGDDTLGSVGQNRELYIAPGGWYNQIEAKDGKMRVGGDGTVWVNHTLNTVYHAKLEWKGTTITSTVTDESGAVLKSDSRTNTSYTDMTAGKEDMKRWAFRCEDGEVEIDNFSFTDGNTTYTEDFDYSGSRVATMLQKDYWNIESGDYTYGVDKNTLFDEPAIQHNALILEKGQSVAFTWTKIPGMGAFDANKTYTFSFDATIIRNDGATLYGNASWIRELFVAPGGWFNQVEFKDGKLRAGGDGSNLANYNFNELYHVTIAWKNQTITSTVKDSAGNVVKSDSRTNSAYGDMTANNGAMNHWIFRCEDGSSKISNFSFTDGTTTFTDNFDYEPTIEMTSAEAFLASELWAKESDVLPGKLNGNAPEIENGKMILSTSDGVSFDWTKVPGVGAFDTNTKYIFEFDVEMLSWEGDGGWMQSRELYFAPGGYYNQLEFYESNVRTGYNQYIYFDATKPVHAKVVWKGDTITTTASYADGTVINTGSRTNSAYTDMTLQNEAMRYWVFRSEDGEVAISNLTFTAKTDDTEQQSFSVDAAKNHVVYEADVTVADGEKAALSFDGGELVSFADDGMKIAGTVAGSYPAGTYHVKLDLNFAQKNALVTVTLPDGGILRRGDSALLGGATKATAITFSYTGTSAVANETVSYPETVARTVTLPSAPSKTNFETKAYNLTSSFDSDAKTTRSFAWTAVKDFDNMAVVYAKADEFEDAAKRITVSGVKETPEEEANQTVYYYKVDITGLQAGTSYTYMIGDLTDNEWGKTYTFTTEGNKETNFSFIAIGDTQSGSWEGYSYAKAAVDYALAEAPNDVKFMLHTGDVTEQGSQDYMWNYFFDAMKDITETLPMFATVGNHDTWGTDTNKAYGDLLFDLHFNHPNNGGSTAFGDLTADELGQSANKNLVKNLDETFYSFDYGNVHVVVLNSGSFLNLNEDNAILAAQKDWLEKDLANNDATWTVALMHQGVYHRYNTSWYCNALQDVLEDNGVDLIFNGHEHIMKRTYPIKDAKIVSKENPDVIKKGTGTVYSTIGSTITSHDRLANTVEEALMVNGVEADQASYTVVDVSEDALTVTIKTLNGLVVDSFTIENDRMKIDGVTVGDDAATLQNLKKDTEATVYFNYRSGNGANQNYTVMAAYYDGKELVATQTVASGTATESFDYEFDFTVPDIGNANLVKFFVWDSTDNAIPLVEAFEIQ